jgi:putative membrane protein
MRIALLAAVLAVLTSHVAAQLGNPAGWAPDTQTEKPGAPLPNQSNYQDRLFAQLATAGGLAEVDLGRLAADKTTHAGIKRFAQRMVDDHRKINQALKLIVDKSKMPLPAKLDAERRKIRDDLTQLTGADFDRAYLAAQVVEHQKAAQLLAWEIGQGEDAELQRFASETLPTVLDHLRIARDLMAEMRNRVAAGDRPDPSHERSHPSRR